MSFLDTDSELAYDAAYEAPAPTATKVDDDEPCMEGFESVRATSTAYMFDLLTRDFEEPLAMQERFEAVFVA